MTADGLPDPAAPAAAPSSPSPPPALLVAGRYDEGPGYAVHRPDGARNMLVTWTTAGEGRFRQGGAEVGAGAGDLVVLGPDVPHDYAIAQGCDRWAFWWVHCQARASWRAWLGPYERGERLYAVRPVPAAVHGHIDAAFRRMHAHARWSGTGAPPGPLPGRAVVAEGAAARELALGGVEEVILLAAGAAAGGAEAADDGVDARVRRVEALIEADPAAPHTVASLAAGVALSPSRLAHLFAAEVGRTPLQALRDARLRHAARLLELTDLPVDRVAAASGFAGPHHFSRVFRARFGTPPGAYRRGLRGGPGRGA